LAFNCLISTRPSKESYTSLDQSWV
jgi:hypothetical protein